MFVEVRLCTFNLPVATGVFRCTFQPQSFSAAANQLQSEAENCRYSPCGKPEERESDGLDANEIQGIIT